MILSHKKVQSVEFRERFVTSGSRRRAKMVPVPLLEARTMFSRTR